MKSAKSKKALPSEQAGPFLETLQARFEKNTRRHEGLDWSKVQARLDANPEKLWSLHEMETTGGEPDVVGHDSETGEFIFFDCSPESPKGRTSVCYDREGLESQGTSFERHRHRHGHRHGRRNPHRGSNTAPCRNSANSTPGLQVGSKHPQTSESSAEPSSATAASARSSSTTTALSPITVSAPFAHR